MPSHKPTIDPTTQHVLDALVGKYGEELTAEAVNVARKKGDTIVVKSHVDAALRHLEDAPKSNRLVQAALVFGAGVFGIAGAEFITQMKATPINATGVSYCVAALVASALSVMWGIMHG